MRRWHVERGLFLCIGCVVGVWGVHKAIGADFVIGTPTNLGPDINTGAGEGGPSISADGLSLYFASDRANGYGGRGDIWVATREKKNGEWSPPANLGPEVNSSACEAYPSISADGLTLFFCDGHWGVSAPQRPGGYGDADLWMTTRQAHDTQWGPPVNLGPVVNSPYWDGSPAISSEGLSLYFSSNRPGSSGGLDIYVTTRATTREPWGPPINLGSPLNTTTSEGGASVSADGLALFFSKNSPETSYWDFWMTRRKTRHDSWEIPVSLGPAVNTSSIEWSLAIVPDTSILYFSSLSRSGGIGYYDLWQAPIVPVVDFNTDGKVDLVDLVMLIDDWGTNKTLCDIGPMPWGDGKVDIEDLKVFMTYWEKENPGK